jgi:hypothetical protein
MLQDLLMRDRRRCAGRPSPSKFRALDPDPGQLGRLALAVDHDEAQND